MSVFMCMFTPVHDAEKQGCVCSRAHSRIIKSSAEVTERIGDTQSSTTLLLSCFLHAHTQTHTLRVFIVH